MCEAAKSGKLYSTGIFSWLTALKEASTSTLYSSSAMEFGLVFSALRLGTLEKEMATHSSVLAWRIPGTGEPGGLPSMGSPQSRTQLKQQQQQQQTGHCPQGCVEFRGWVWLGLNW